jgi:hypothetical protein
MYSPNNNHLDELTELDNEIAELSARIVSIKAEIRERETRRNDANIIASRDNAYQRQSITDEARATYRTEGKAIGQLASELQPLERRYSELNTCRGKLHRDLLQRDAQSQYNSETVERNLAKIAELSKGIAEYDIKLNKLLLDLAVLDKLSNEQYEKQVGHDRYKAEYKACKQELEQAEAAFTLDANSTIPVGLRGRVSTAKKKYDFTVKQLPTQALLDSIEAKRESLQNQIANIESDKKELEAEQWAKRSIIAEIQYRENIPKLLTLVKTMVVCDSMSNGKSNVGQNLLDHLKNKGLRMPRTFDYSPNIFSGILDNLDEEKALIQFEFNSNLTDSSL